MAPDKENSSKRISHSSFDDLLNSMDSFLNGSFNHFNSFMNPKFVVQTYETDTNVVIKAELPNINRDQIQLEIIRNQVRISVENDKDLTEKKDSNKQLFNQQVSQRMERTISLPFIISEEDTKARYRNGLLKISTPKNKETRKFIKIN